MRRHPGLWYSLLRLGTIVVVFAILAAVGVWWLLAAVIAMLVAMLVSFLFLGRLREAYSAELARRRDARREARAARETRDTDENVEDDALDQSGSGDVRPQ